MIHAYDRLYLNDARSRLANCLDYAVNTLGYDIEEFYRMFLKSDICDRFEKGDPFFVSGKSGIELALLAIEKAYGIEAAEKMSREKITSGGKSREYWCGWALAFYQWYTSCSLRRLEETVPVSSVIRMYDKYHEMDIMHFVERIDHIRSQKVRMGSYLKQLREARGYSQRELAQATGIPLKTLQHYEQGTKSIAKANAAYVLSLAAILGCNPVELLDAG